MPKARQLKKSSQNRPLLNIFHRLKIRDGKPEYMQDVPRILGYIHQVLEQHTELGKIKQLVNQATILE